MNPSPWRAVKLSMRQTNPYYVVRQLSQSQWEQLRTGDGGIARFGSLTKAESAARGCRPTRETAMNNVTTHKTHAGPTAATPCEYTVSISVRVHDVEELYKHAIAVGTAKADMTEAEAADTLRGEDGKVNISACLIMVFDPGASPPGCDIQDSSAE